MGILLGDTIYDALPGAVPWVIATHPCEVVDYGHATTVAEHEVVQELHHILVIEFHTEANMNKLLLKT